MLSRPMPASKAARKVKLKRGSPNMGEFSVQVGVSRLGGGPETRIEAMVDTGSTHSIFPEAFLLQLGVSPIERRRYSLADGREVEYDFGMADIDIDGRALICPVVFGAENQYLLGATTLEIFELMVDPVGTELVPREIYTGPI